MTKLEIVNHMLAVQGERGANSLTTGHPSVIKAVATLDQTNQEFQGRGWYFNKDTAVTLTPDVNGELSLGYEILEFSVTSSLLGYQLPEEKARFTLRGTKIYDSIRHTTNIGHRIVADITRLVPIEDLPIAASSYLRHLAAEIMFVDEDGDSTKETKLQERTARAWQQLQAAHLKVTSPNRLDSPVAQALRYRIDTGGFSHGNPALLGGRRY